MADLSGFREADLAAWEKDLHRLRANMVKTILKVFVAPRVNKRDAMRYQDQIFHQTIASAYGWTDA